MDASMDDLPSSPYDRVVSRWRLGGAPPAAAADDDVPVRCLDDGHLGPGADAVRDLLGRAMWLHVAVGAGPAVHAVVYTAVAPRTRRGVVLDDDGRPLSLGDAACQARLTAFQSIDAGDRVVRVCGYGLQSGAGLCHCLCLRLASGRAFCVAGSDLSRRGPAFDYACPPGCAVVSLRFSGGTCQGIDVAATTCVEIKQCTSSLSHFSAMTRPSWLGRAVRNRQRHAIEQASRRWRGGRRDNSARTRRKILTSTQPSTT